MSKLSDSQKTLLDTAVTIFQDRLAVDPAAQEYLDGRGFDPALADTFRLGVVPHDPPAGFEQYTGRLAIPYLTPTGVVDVRFRSLGGDSPKYMSRPGTAGRIYNVGAFQRGGSFLAVCEGEIDAMTADGMAGIPCVGIPGANGWKPLWARAFQDYDTVFVLCDGDDPGREFGKRVRKDVENAVVVHLPEGTDVNSIVTSQGVDALREKVGL